MKLEHSFTVPTGIDDAWKILLDIERIGPCMPGASVDSVTGDDFTGSVKVKLGPIGLTYKGKASFVEKDEAAHRAVIDARGKDARGNGTASAKVTATLSERGGETHVKVDTDLDITGKPAQFGRGVMVDVGNKLIGIFADNLAEEIRGNGAADTAVDTAEAPAAAPAAAPAEEASTGRHAEPQPTAPGPAEPAAAAAAAAAAPAGAPTAAPVAAAPVASANGATTAKRPQREVEPINLIESAGPAVAKRLAPPIAALLAIVLFVVWRRRR